MYPKLFIFYLIREIVVIDIINHFNKQFKSKQKIHLIINYSLLNAR